MPVYVTPTIWSNQCAWSGPSKLQTHPDKRVFELLQSCFVGMGKALSSADDRVAFTFKHWYWPRDVKPGAKKQRKAKLGARLMLHPETDEPWLLIFDRMKDSTANLKKGDVPDDSITEHRGEDSDADQVEPDVGTGLDQGSAD